MLVIENLIKTYAGPQGPVRAVQGLSLSVAAGEFVAVQGPSGCGKSTSLLAAGGLLVPDQGEVAVDGQDLYTMTAGRRAAFRAATIGFVFQQFHLIPYLRVLDNVLTPSWAFNKPDAHQRARELIARFGLESRIDHVPSELSTGERQRTAMARALLNQPKLLLADEPTGNLDEENAEIVLGYLTDFARDGGAVLMVTHEPHAAAHCHRTIQLKNGKLA